MPRLVQWLAIFGCRRVSSRKIRGLDVPFLRRERDAEQRQRVGIIGGHRQHPTGRTLRVGKTALLHLQIAVFDGGVCIQHLSTHGSRPTPVGSPSKR